MSDVFIIEMLPAREGDCLWVTYGIKTSPRHILIDGGRSGTYNDLKTRLVNLPSDQKEFELLVITHVDRDHIEGVLSLIKDVNSPVKFKDIWFNGFAHLEGPKPEYEYFSPVQGEILTGELKENNLPWNKKFSGGSIEAPIAGTSDPISLEGGLELTLVSPDRHKLEKLILRWEQECIDAGIAPTRIDWEPLGPEEEDDEFESFGAEIAGVNDINDLAEEPFKKDPSTPNGSSIAFLMEFAGKRILLSGDAHVDRLIKAIKPLADNSPGGRLKLDAFKIPHHGSRKNLSKDLLDLIDCSRFLVSTNGSYFNHPDPVAMARIIKYGGANPKIIFNYQSDETKIWNNSGWQSKLNYSAIYPTRTNNGFAKLDILNPEF